MTLKISLFGSEYIVFSKPQLWFVFGILVLVDILSKRGSQILIKNSDPNGRVDSQTVFPAAKFVMFLKFPLKPMYLSRVSLFCIESYPW